MSKQNKFLKDKQYVKLEIYNLVFQSPYLYVGTSKIEGESKEILYP
jgi:hypothetical protein